MIIFYSVPYQNIVDVALIQQSIIIPIAAMPYTSCTCKYVSSEKDLVLKSPMSQVVSVLPCEMAN